MALHWNLTGIENHKALCWKGDAMNPITETLIFVTMLVGVPKLNAATLETCCVRVNLYQRLFGALLSMARPEGQAGRTPRPLTRTDIESHLGLSTNASTETYAHFARRMTKLFAEQEKLA